MSKADELRLDIDDIKRHILEIKDAIATDKYLNDGQTAWTDQLDKLKLRLATQEAALKDELG